MNEDYRTEMEYGAARAKARKNGPLLGYLVLIAVFAPAAVMIINTLPRDDRGPAAVIAAVVVVVVMVLGRKQ